MRMRMRMSWHFSFSAAQIKEQQKVEYMNSTDVLLFNIAPSKCHKYHETEKINRNKYQAFPYMLAFHGTYLVPYSIHWLEDLFALLKFSRSKCWSHSSSSSVLLCKEKLFHSSDCQHSHIYFPSYSEFSHLHLFQPENIKTFLLI